MYVIPTQLVSDNEPQFTLEDFMSFMTRNGIKHIRSAPYHPSTNGTAECFVQTFKKAMKASQNSSLTQNHCLYNLILTYCTMPHTTINEPPCQLTCVIMGRMLHTRWNLLQPDFKQTVLTKQPARKKIMTNMQSPENCVWEIP